MSDAQSEVQALLERARTLRDKFDVPKPVLQIEDLIAQAPPGPETTKLLRLYDKSLERTNAEAEKGLALVRARLDLARATSGVLENALARLNDDEYTARRVTNESAVDSAFALFVLGETLIVNFPLLETFVESGASKSHVQTLQNNAGVGTTVAKVQGANGSLPAGLLPLPNLNSGKLNAYEERAQVRDVAFVNAATQSAFNAIQEQFRVGTQAILDYEVGSVVRGLESWYETNNIGLRRNLEGELVPINSAPGQMLQWMGTPFSWSAAGSALSFAVTEYASPVIVYSVMYLLGRSVFDMSGLDVASLSPLNVGIVQAVCNAAAMALTAGRRLSVPFLIAGTSVLFTGVAGTVRKTVSGLLYPARTLAGFVSRRVSSLFSTEPSVPEGVRDNIDDDLAASALFRPSEWLSDPELRVFRPPPSNLNYAEHFYFYQRCCADVVMFVKQIRDALSNDVIKRVGTDEPLGEYAFAFSFMSATVYSVATIAKTAIAVLEKIADVSAMVETPLASPQQQQLNDTNLQNTMLAMALLDNDLQAAVPYLRFVAINFDAQMQGVKAGGNNVGPAYAMFQLLVSLADYVFDFSKFAQADASLLRTSVEVLLKQYFRPTPQFTSAQRAFAKSLREINANSRYPTRWFEAFSYALQRPAAATQAAVAGATAKGTTLPPAPGLPQAATTAAQQQQAFVPFSFQPPAASSSAAPALLNTFGTPLPNTQSTAGALASGFTAGAFPRGPLPFNVGNRGAPVLPTQTPKQKRQTVMNAFPRVSQPSAYMAGAGFVPLAPVGAVPSNTPYKGPAVASGSGAVPPMAPLKAKKQSSP